MKNTSRYLTLPSVDLDSALIKKLTSSVQKTDLFGKLSISDINKLTSSMVAVELPEGDAIYVEDEPADYVSMLISGQLIVLKETDKGKSRQIAVIHPGRSVGEMSLVDGKPHSATVVAGEKSIVAILSQQAMESLVKSDPKLGTHLFRSFAEVISVRLRKTNNVLAQYLD
jgi:CRP-like cAMP-binding protein